MNSLHRTAANLRALSNVDDSAKPAPVPAPVPPAAPKSTPTPVPPATNDAPPKPDTPPKPAETAGDRVAAWAKKQVATKINK